MLSFRRTGKALAVFVCAVLLAALTQNLWLRWMGESLVRTDALAKADAVLVLAGDWNGDRITKGAELVKQGYAPIVLVSGPMPIYGVNEATLAIDYAVSRGYPRDIFVPMVSNSFSTRDEANFAGPELRKRGVHRLLIVTSNFHTRRAGHLFRSRLGTDIDLRMIASRHPNFTTEGWWKDREGQKVFFFEWTKTIATIFGL